MKLLSFIFRTSGVTVSLGALAGIVAGGSSALVIVLLNRMVVRDFFPHFLAAFVATNAVAFLSTIASELIVHRVCQDMLFKLRMQLAERLLNAPLRHLEEVGAPRVLASLVGDLGAIANSFSTIPILLTNVATLVACLAYMAWLSWTTMLVFMGMLLAVTMGYVGLSMKAARALGQARRQQDLLVKHFRAITDGAKELKLNRDRREDFLSNSLRGVAAAHHDLTLAGQSRLALSGHLALRAFISGVGILLLQGEGRAASNQSPITAGYALMVLYLISSILAIAAVYPPLLHGSVALGQVEELDQTLIGMQELTDEPLPAPMREWESLALCEATHAYRSDTGDRPFVLGPLDLIFRPGEIVFIVGGNGSGKSTLAKLVAGLYAPESGHVELGSQRITASNREWYRQHFSVVFMDFFLFDGLLGLKAANLDDEARQYLVKFGLDKKVSVENGMFSTLALSQGQRKRLALLTSYLEDRPIHIFDEWAADQDPSFKRIFYTQLLPQLRAKGKCVIVITHDDAYFSCADQIVRLENGRIAGDSTGQFMQRIKGSKSVPPAGLSKGPRS